MSISETASEFGDSGESNCSKDPYKNRGWTKKHVYYAYIRTGCTHVQIILRFRRIFFPLHLTLVFGGGKSRVMKMVKKNGRGHTDSSKS